ncbi:hypothetical protein GCM10011506_37610 [Marivirga lumbricoides]|uniref:Magnesium citrate secondary transporter n=1 Tax=Marivirga lumbricoides TaxID=1046115 RepID=A0ABQ1MWI6_9BACT|nr:hypothetical protein GCM10011506_37610 [Marivirga lumbricoides]
MWGIFIPYVHSYLDDLLCLPIVLGLTTQFLQWIHPARRFYYLSHNHIIISIVFFSLVFEILYPFMFPLNYTADIIDILFYALGGYLYYSFVSLKTKNRWLTFVNHKREEIQ